MAQKPVTRSLRPEVLRASLANLTAQRNSTDFRRALKQEQGTSTASEDAEIADLDAQIAAINEELSSQPPR